MTWRVLVHSMIPFGNLEDRLVIINEPADGVSAPQYIAGPFVMKTLEPGGLLPEDAVLMKARPLMGHSPSIDALLKAFADAAWERGVKPTKYEEPTSELSATKKHLEDMRAIVWQAPKP